MDESGLELMFLTVSIASHEVVSVSEQQKANYFWNDDLREHFIDTILHYGCGLRRAIFLKYDEEVDASQLEEIAQAVCDYEGGRLADEYVVVTEEDVNVLDYENAQEIIEAAKYCTSETREMVISALSNMDDIVTPKEVGAFTGLGKTGAIAAIALIQSGALELSDHEPISSHSALINTGKFAA